MADFSASPPPAPPFREEKPLPISALNRQVRQILESNFPLCWVSGEISNLTLAASGHAYFSLKDDQAQARCVMFRSRVQTLGFRPENGQKVEARVLVSLYEPRGDFQLNVEALRPAGLGNLYEQFVRLKARLDAEGLFAAENRLPIPAHPRRIGIVTSPQAAALRDVLTTLARRAPHVPVILYPSLVQGDEAPPRIVAALEAAYARAEVDVLLVVRGGGSIEDLWAFNDERVVRAVAAAPLPVISGIGHETDFTLTDFAADLRAPTPTGAAELASPDREALLDRLDELHRRLARRAGRLIDDHGQRLDYLARRLIHPAQRIARHRETLQALAQRLAQAGRRRLAEQHTALSRLDGRLRARRPTVVPQQARLVELEHRLHTASQHRLEATRHRLEQLGAALAHLSPEGVLARGYALAFDADGQIVRHAAALRPGDGLALRLHQGSAAVRVESTSLVPAAVPKRS
ncbi:exodeoxyribonuclease VII, large subunit [Oryzomicrobium terrae]|uniref:Exodeoxyribonuclease 7 large subunit n=1 Tax=Oryzomicrobium terrae TaxID=1735038 RepID=A0A5C1E9Q7_9RHOO|nr:exodeoxyribonuclease VII large subunit [Oryzomicrobium terrae]QEL65622.1 exodeoxyribonuclease VII, large subunit [Oryzomicrobium terrae]